MLSCCKFLCERFATSCKELYQCNPALPSGYYNITTPQGAERVYCVMNTINCGNITGGWMRAAYIDMTNENNNCPKGLNVTVVGSTRMCTRSHTDGGCSSVTFPTFNVSYSKVCGRARGYQFATPDGFSTSNALQGYPDVEGLIITHGSPRNHIWSFAAAQSKDFNYLTNCPCSSPILAMLHLLLSEKTTSASLGTVEQWYTDGTLTTLCGTHRGVQVGAPAVIVVVRGSLPH